MTAIREGWPILLAPPIVGSTFGLLARQAGLDIPQTIGMSLLVFAGAAQFAMLDLLRNGAGAIVIVVTVFLINLRHALMGTALRPYFIHASPIKRLGLAYVLTDEAFAMGAGWSKRGGRGLSYYVTFALSLWASWEISTAIGATAGAALPDPHRLGLDFAITATFVAIVVLGVRDRRDVVIALVAGAIAGILRASGLAVVAVVIAGGLAPLLLLMRER